jgi:adenylate cyclase
MAARKGLAFTVEALEAFAVVRRELQNKLDDKMCVIGRVDTGTTDIGVNPFYREYVNVGTHAVVLDTILSKAFITPLPVYWSILVSFLFVPLLIICAVFYRPLWPGAGHGRRGAYTGDQRLCQNGT